MSTYQRRRALRAYSGGMQRAGSNPDEGPTPEQRQDFANWVQDVVDSFGEPPKKWSVTKLAEKGGVHRNAIYDWIGMKAVPKRETVARFCRGLGIDFAEPAQLLGWGAGLPPLNDTVRLGAFIRRAKALAAEEGTSPARREDLLALIGMAEEARRSAASQRLSAEQTERRAKELLGTVLEAADESTDQ